MSKRKTYVVTAERDGAWWFLRVPELPGVYSQTKRLEQADQMARDAIALMLEVPEKSFDIRVQARLTSDVDALLLETRQARDDASALAARASALTARAIRALLKAGLSVRDAGALLGVSFQRAAQLAKEKPRAPAKETERDVKGGMPTHSAGPIRISYEGAAGGGLRPAAATRRATTAARAGTARKTTARKSTASRTGGARKTTSHSHGTRRRSH